MIDDWGGNAISRKRQIESGIDLTFSKVFIPIYKDILEAIKPNSVLEIGSGTGNLAQAVSIYLGRYLGIELSKGMYELAQSGNSNPKITFMNSILTKETEIGRFDIIIAHMVLHTTDNASQILRESKERLNSNGMVLLSIPHPCFYNNYKKFLGNDYSYMGRSSYTVDFSISLDPKTIIKSVPYIHRPISDYVNMIQSAGLMIIEMIEVFPEMAIQELYPKVWDEPRYCFFKCKIP
jgi:SAM-dependent methyltransferase